LLLVGEVGNGKSTTANYLMLNLEKRLGKNVDTDFDIEQCFEARRSASSVTKEVQQREFREMVLIDTPGFNDSDKKGTSDIVISAKIIHHLLSN
jgi:predicted GTPase